MRIRVQQKHLSTVMIMVSLMSLVCLSGFRGYSGRFTAPSDPHHLQQLSGEELYKTHCVRCHGADGGKGFFGAKDLRKSQLADSLIVRQIENGKRFMPSFRKKIAPADINLIVAYVKTLRYSR